MERYGPYLLTPEMNVEKGYISIEEGVIQEKVKLEKGLKPSKNFSVEGVVCPGPVNAHTHLADGFLDPPEGLSLAELVGPNGFKEKKLKSSTFKEIKDSIAKGLSESFMYGTTITIDFRENGLKGLKCFKEASKKTPVKALALGRTNGDPVEEILKNSEGLGISSVNDYPFQYLKDIVKKIPDDKLLGIHAAESKEGQEKSLKNKGKGEIELALELNPDFLVHATNPLEKEIDLLEDSDIPVVICPRSNAKTGVGFPPIKEIIERGIPFMIGTDNAMFNEPSVINEANFIMEKLNKNPEYFEPVYEATFFGGKHLDFNHGMKEGEEVRIVVLNGFPGKPVVTHIKNKRCFYKNV